MIKKKKKTICIADNLIAIKISNESTGEILDFINIFIKDNRYQYAK